VKIVLRKHLHRKSTRNNFLTIEWMVIYNLLPRRPRRSVTLKNVENRVWKLFSSHWIVQHFRFLFDDFKVSMWSFFGGGDVRVVFTYQTQMAFRWHRRSLSIFALFLSPEMNFSQRNIQHIYLLKSLYGLVNKRAKKRQSFLQLSFLFCLFLI